MLAGSGGVSPNLSWSRMVIAVAVIDQKPPSLWRNRKMTTKAAKNGSRSRDMSLRPFLFREPQGQTHQIGPPHVGVEAAEGRLHHATREDDRAAGRRDLRVGLED